jgi:thiol-disulfide isomerase/thioredoxin
MRRGASAVAAGTLAASVVSGCTSHIGSSGDQGFVSGDGITTSLKAAERRTPGPVAGTTLSGKRVSLADHRGRIVVVNVWGSWCAPCRREAPMLGQAAKDLAGRGVVFLGIDSRDGGRAAPLAFERRFGVSYDSIYDRDGRTLLPFHGTLTPNAVPSTVIIDRKGRVAASVLGPITRTTLYDLLQDVSGKNLDTGGPA